MTARDWSEGTWRYGPVYLCWISGWPADSRPREAAHTFMVCIEEVIVCIAERKLVGHGRYFVLAVVVPPQLVVGEGLYEFSLRLDGSAWRSIKWSARAGRAEV